MDLQKIIKTLEETDHVDGDWKPRERRTLNAEGLLVVRKDKGWRASKGNPIVEEMLRTDKKTQKIKIDEKLSRVEIYFYLQQQQLEIHQERDMKIGCGYRDAWDPCDCPECRYNTKRHIGYIITLD